MSSFLSESEVYSFLNRAGFEIPAFFSIQNEKDIESITFSSSDDVVIKGEVDGVFHKSDVGLVVIESYSPQRVLECLTKWKAEFKQQFKRLLVIEKVAYKAIKDIPSEIFFSLSYESSLGHVARLGIGGIHSEFWAKKEPPIYITADLSVTQVLEKLSYHTLGHLWFGLLRQQEALLTVESAKKFIQAILHLLNMNDLPDLIEVNPMVITEDDRIVALDGVGVIKGPSEVLAASKRPVSAILSPKKVAIAGVSTKKRSFGNMILDNIVSSQLGKENIFVLRDGLKEFEGCPCLSDITALKERGVDALIVALPPGPTIEIVEQLCEQQSGAEVIYLVAGGIGDGADQQGHAKKIEFILQKYRKQGKWTPTLVGPNSLGIVLSKLKFNSLFIPPEKLDVEFSEKGKIAFISQSGAFFITRLSNSHQLPLKYAYCVGNQLDLTVGQTLSVLKEDDSVELYALYIEGFKPGDLTVIAREVREIVARKGNVVIYKAGRTEEGSKAAAGHTGAMGGAYDIESSTLESAGAIVCHSIEQFSAKMRFYGHYSQQPKIIGVISNAGFETVNSADLFADSLIAVDETIKLNLEDFLKKVRLDHLVSVSNPFDITPMADESVYLYAIEQMLAQYDAVIASIVPLTERIDTSENGARELATKLNIITKKWNKPLLVVVDSGSQYDSYRNILEQQGVLVFSNLEQASLLLR